MTRQHFFHCWLGACCVLSAFLLLAEGAHAQRVLFHGSDANPTAGDDGAVFSHLQSLGFDVSYVQSAAAAPNGASATGFDAVVISSTTDSGTLLGSSGGYADLPIGVLNWESALTRDDRPGEFFLSEGGGTTDGQTDIEILAENMDHPIVSGIGPGPVPVFNSPQTMSRGNGVVGDGVDILANLTTDADAHTIMAAEAGAPLLGNGSPGMPATAPARRVMFSLHDVGFTDLTPAGLQLFNNALNWILNITDPLILGDFNDDGMVTEEDFVVLSDNLGAHIDGPVTVREGDVNFDGKIDTRDFHEFKTELLPGALAQAAGIPEPSSVVLLSVIAAVLAAGCVRRARRAAA